MTLRSSNVDYYNKMQELEERLKRSEEERMLLQRQFDHLLLANHDKERARVSIVEARYKRFLEEDKRRRDRNSSLLQALDRIDSHTASLAAKTERMRALRKHYEAFIAHSYPGWHTGLDRPYYPLAAIAPAPNVMTRVTEITGYDTESAQRFPDPVDYSETQYHALPSIPAKPFYPLTSPLCRSDIAIASREDCPVVGRSTYPTGSSAIRSASLSPSRVRDLSSQYDGGKISSSSLRHYDVYSPPKSLDAGHSPRSRSEIHFSKKREAIPPSRTTHYYTEEKPYHRLSTSNNRILDYDHGNSDIEADQNTSGDLLNLSNLSLSDDCILNESEVLYSPSPYTSADHNSYSNPRNYSSVKANTSVSLSMPHKSVRQHVSPREVFIPKRSGSLSPPVLTSPSPKSILSPRSRKPEISSSLPLSDNVHRILLPSEDIEIRRLDSSLSPSRLKPTWQTLRPSYLPSPPRNNIRRSVTFTDPEYENPYVFRDDDVSLYSGSYGSLRRHSPSLPISSWESSDHERYLRDKQGREKDAFREKIERLKELIQENKDQEIGLPATSLKSKITEYDQHKKSSRESSLDRESKAKVSQSRRSSFVRELSSDHEEEPFQITPREKNNSSYTTTDLRNDLKSEEDYDKDTSEAVSEKEQWSGQFDEKEEDAKEKFKNLSEETVILRTLNGLSKETLQNSDDAKNGSSKLHEETDPEKSIPEQRNNTEDVEKPQLDQPSSEQAVKDAKETEVNQSTNFIKMESQNQMKGSVEAEKHTPVEAAEKTDSLKSEPEANSSLETEKQQPVSTEEKAYDDLTDPNNFSYKGDEQQQAWSMSDDKSQVPQQNMQYNYEQGDDSTTYEGQAQNDAKQGQDGAYEPYTVGPEHEQQGYESYKKESDQPPDVQGDYNETGYEAYQESQQAADSVSTYPEYTDDPNQYQQSYEPYTGDQQYSEQQDQSNYQYSQDPDKTQYEYEGQEYNYQQNTDNYNYQQDPNYQQDSTYQQDQTYQPDQNYSQEQNYQQDQNYPQEPEYQQDSQYQEAGYEGSQQYEGYQPGAEDISEDTTTPSAESNYQGQQYQGEAAEQQQTLEQYRALLGADPSSEPAYSDSSEIENQMAAVVGQGVNNAPPSVLEPSQSTPPASSSPAGSAAAKGKAGAKKKPQLTRKQSSVTAENVEGKQQQVPSLTPMPETHPDSTASQLASDSDFDVSSSH